MPIMNPDQIDQFNAPIPGEMLTAEMGARPWQRPPQFNTVEEVIDFYTDKLKDPKGIRGTSKGKWGYYKGGKFRPD